MPRNLAVLIGVDAPGRRTFASLLRSVAPQLTLRCFPSARRALAFLRRHRTTTAVAALNVPDMDGTELLCEIVERELASCVVAWADRRDACVDYFFSHLPVAAVLDPAALDRPGAARLLRRALSASGNGNGSRPPPAPASRSVLHRLTLRELEVLAWIADGSTDLECGRHLGCSAKTVHTHRQRIMSKLGLHRRAEVVTRSVQLGIIRITPQRVLFPGRICARLRRRAETPALPPIQNRTRTPAPHDHAR